MNKGIVQMAKLGIAPLAIWPVLFLTGIFFVSCRNSHEFHSFSFYFNGLNENEIYFKSATVLSRNARMGFRPNSPHRGGNIHYAREDCTPPALLNTTADFVWWDKRFTDPKNKFNAPLKPEQRRTCSLPFPEFDLKQDWTCDFTLQRDDTWVGKFDGVKVKPINANPKNHASRKLPLQPWLYVFIRNNSEEEIWFSRQDGKFINGETKMKLYLKNILPDGQFRGFAAHSHAGSVYRPSTGSKIVGVFGSRDRGQQPFEFSLPEFSSEVQNWYCYFTLNRDLSWTTIFEGTANQKTTEKE